MVELLYDRVVKYSIRASCATPLHIGSGDGTKGEVLVHPVDHRPFIQASSLAGAFREFYKNHCLDEGNDMLEHLFGGGGEESRVSAVRFTDADFQKISMELRPRLKIDAKTGTCSQKVIKGSLIQSGQKFEEEYVAAGSEFSFQVFICMKEENLEQDFEKILRSFDGGNIRLGGQKSNGCGFITLQKVQKRKFLLKNPKDRRAWIEDRETEYEDITKTLQGKEQDIVQAYRLAVKCRTDGELLVKGIVGDMENGELNDRNMQNAKGEFIIPGSAWKGVLRSRVEAITAYLHLDSAAGEMFGEKSDKNGNGKSGMVCILDSIVGHEGPVRTRIAIDKFTGGVKYGAMVREKLVSGELRLSIQISENPYSDSQCGLLMLALRDMAAGLISVGSGSSAGRGYLLVEEIRIERQDKHTAVIFPRENRIEDEHGIIARCLCALKEQPGLPPVSHTGTA